MWINLCVELEIIFGTIDVGREEVEYLNKLFENKLTLANQQSCQNIDCFWSQLKIPNKLGNIRKRKDVINVNILQLIWNKISIPRNIDTILGRRLDCFTCYLWFSWLTVVEDDDDGVDSSLMDLFLLVAFWLIYSICNVKYIMKIVLVTISSSSRDKTCTS